MEGLDFTGRTPTIRSEATARRTSNRRPEANTVSGLKTSESPNCELPPIPSNQPSPPPLPSPSPIHCLSPSPCNPTLTLTNNSHPPTCTNPLVHSSPHPTPPRTTPPPPPNPISPSACWPLSLSSLLERLCRDGLEEGVCCTAGACGALTQGGPTTHYRYNTYQSASAPRTAAPLFYPDIVRH